MTRIFHREYDDKFILNIEGHSGFGDKGADIVCAGISTLAITLLNCLKDEDSAGRLRFVREIVRDGYMNLEIELFDFAKQRTQAMIEAILSGFYILAEEYPKYIEIE